MRYLIVYQRGRLYLITSPPKSYEAQHTADFLAAFPDQVDRFGSLQSRAVDLEGNKKIRFEVLNPPELGKGGREM
jgi:hypothetical protein